MSPSGQSTVLVLTTKHKTERENAKKLTIKQKIRATFYEKTRNRSA